MLGINGRRIISYLSGTCNDIAGFYSALSRNCDKGFIARFNAPTAAAD
jgi:hypothetical protein